MKNFLGLLVIILAYFLIIFPVKANDCNGQYGQYGGCTPSKTIVVDKLVGKPNTNVKEAINADYVDNLSPSDPRFKEGQMVFFKVKVKNTSSSALNNVTFKDFVPSYIEPVQGPGTYDASSRTITFNAGDFATDEEKVYYLKMQVNSQNNLPTDKGLFCLINKAKAYNNDTSDSDAAQFCIEKQVTGVSKVPSSGPEFGLILLGLQITGITAGLALKKRTI